MYDRNQYNIVNNYHSIKYKLIKNAKYMWNHRAAQIAKPIRKKKKETRGIILPGFNAVVIKTVRY